MEKRNIQIDIDTARKWYKGDDESLKVLAKQAFTKEELEEPNLPKSWDEYCNNYNSNNGYIIQLATLGRLLKIRDVYRQGWKPDWTDWTENEQIWFVCCDDESFNIDWGINRAHLFSFPTKELAEQFLENFKEELKQLKELL